MKLILNIGETEKIKLVVRREPIFGEFYYSVNGKKTILKSTVSFRTHIDPKKEFEYEFTVGENEKNNIRIVHKVPNFLAGFLPQNYEIYVNGELKKVYKGY